MKRHVCDFNADQTKALESQGSVFDLLQKQLSFGGKRDRVQMC